MTSTTGATYWILDSCASCERTTWMDLLEQVCPDCLNR
jgi:hypothetical protein